MLNKKSKYLQIAFNKSLEEVSQMINLLPPSPKIILEAGTPFIKQYGKKGIRFLKEIWSEKVGNKAYVVADLKTMDRGEREVKIAASAGANAATCLGLAPIETINEFILNCKKLNIDSMIDMLGVEFPFEILQKLKTLPDVVILHRGVDEYENNKQKQVPYNQIHRIKGTYNNILISTAGAESAREVLSGFFNDSNIVIVWRSFYENPQNTKEIAEEFLKLIK